MKHRSTIGIDIGGSRIRAVVWDGSRIIASREFRTPKNLPSFRRAVTALITKLQKKAQGRILGVGIGVAGVVQGTRVRLSPNIPYLKTFDFTSLPVHHLGVDNDARAFARAEWHCGAGRGAKTILAFTLGTGIGRGYGARGRVAALKQFEYPEVWERRYQLIRDREGDERLAKFLGSKLSPIIRRRRPAVVVIGGGITSRRNFFKKLKKQLRKKGVHQPLRLARLGKNAGAIGAALLFQAREIG